MLGALASLGPLLSPLLFVWAESFSDKSEVGERWEVFRLNSFSHNTLVVDGKKQRARGHAPIIGFSDKAPLPHTIVDMSSVYEGQLDSARRGIDLRGEALRGSLGRN